MGAVDDATKSPAPAPRPASQAPPRPSQPPRRSERPSTRPGGSESLVGRMLSGRYRIERLLGEGGMGAVYQAEHTLMRKRLAVKVLHPEMSRMPEVVARFEREAMAAAHIDHPNVAAATDFGKLEDGSFFLVLEFVEGKSLREALVTSPLELGRALHIARQIASALGRAHALGIVHRDLKPENVMLIEREGDTDFVKVLDFGIAKVPVGDLAASQSAADQPALTQLGMVYGTPEYMSPEQALGQAVDPRADLYSLGVITFEMLSGVRPFDHESKVALLGMHVTAPIPTVASKAPEADVPDEVEAIVARMLAKEAALRFSDAKELVDTLLTTVSNLVGTGRLDPIHLDRALGGSSGPLLGPASARLSRASLSNIEPTPSPALHVQTYGMRIVAQTTRFVARARDYGGQIRTNAWAIGGGAVGALVLLVIFITVLTDNRGGPATVTPTATPPKRIESARADHRLEDQIAAAEATLDKGDYAAAITQLTALEEGHSDRADVHRDLERAYISSNSANNAMLEAELWLKADPAAAADPRLAGDVRSTALGRDDPDAALALLATRMGSMGTDILYDLAYPSAHGSAVSKARTLLANPDVRAHASAALTVTLELRAANTCETKKELLARSREVGDARTLVLLRTYLPASGCGFLGLRDCWTCMHRDGSVAAAVDAIDARLKAKP